MTNQEFSNEFDILYNNIMSNQAPGLDEYEKSVFLTEAQENLIISAYNGKNQFGDSFEKTEEIRRYLSDLIKTEYLKKSTKTNIGLSEISMFFQLPEDTWFITYESVDLEDEALGCKNNKNISVVPITQDEYHRIQQNPFRGANERRVLRLDLGDKLIELITKYKIKNYLIRYITKPSPIILSDLSNNLTIDKLSTKTECKLNPAIHRTILERAVKLAIISWNHNAGNE